MPGVLSRLARSPVVNTGTHSIERFAPLAIVGAAPADEDRNERSIEYEVKSLEDFAASDFTYMQGFGFNSEGKIAADQRGDAVFGFTTPVLAACEDVTLGTDDLLVMEIGQKYLQKLDNAHGKVLGLFRSLREQATKTGWRLHIVVPITVLKFDAELTASLSPASNSKTGASTANAKLYIPNTASAGNMKDGPTVKATNRSLDSSGLSGDYIQVALIGGEFRPDWVDC